MCLSLMFVFSLRFSCHIYPQKNVASRARNRADTKWPTAKIDLQIPGRVPCTHTHAYATFVYVRSPEK